MLQFLIRLLGVGRLEDTASSATRAGSAEAGYAPGTKLTYDSKLIDRFTGHHQSLLKIFTAIVAAAEQRNYAELTVRIGTFKRVLSEHLLEENLRLYTYLQHCLASDSQSLELVREMHLEMGAIGRKVNAFIRHYSEFGVSDLNVAKFLEELRGIGAALVDRIQREEQSLYSLYMPPEAYELRVGA
jgi:regulator of sigma D